MSYLYVIGGILLFVTVLSLLILAALDFIEQIGRDE